MERKVARLTNAVQEARKHEAGLERKVEGLSNAIRAKDVQISKLKKENADKLSESDRRKAMAQDMNARPRVGTSFTVTEPPMNRPTDDSGVLGAAVGLALGVGIAGVAAMLRR